MGNVLPEEHGKYVYCPYKMLHACYQTIILMRANREQCGVSNGTADGRTAAGPGRVLRIVRRGGLLRNQLQF